MHSPCQWVYIVDAPCSGCSLVSDFLSSLNITPRRCVSHRAIFPSLLDIDITLIYYLKPTTTCMQDVLSYKTYYVALQNPYLSLYKSIQPTMRLSYLTALLVILVSGLFSATATARIQHDPHQEVQPIVTLLKVRKHQEFTGTTTTGDMPKQTATRATTGNAHTPSTTTAETTAFTTTATLNETSTSSSKYWFFSLGCAQT